MFLSSYSSATSEQLGLYDSVYIRFAYFERAHSHPPPPPPHTHTLTHVHTHTRAKPDKATILKCQHNPLVDLADLRSADARNAKKLATFVSLSLSLPLSVSLRFVSFPSHLSVSFSICFILPRTVCLSLPVSVCLSLYLSLPLSLSAAYFLEANCLYPLDSSRFVTVCETRA